MNDIFSGVGSNITENEIAFGTKANTPDILSTFTSDPKVLAQFESHEKADLNTPWYKRPFSNLPDFELWLKRAIAIAAVMFGLYLFTLYLSLRR